MPPINPANIPEELKQIHQWVCWKSEIREGKPTKVPYRASLTEKRAAVDDPTSWAAFAKAMRHIDDYDGVGFVLTAPLKLVGIDLDKCVVDGKAEPWAQAIVERMQTYTEISPSGTGLRLWLRGTLPVGRRRKGAFEIYNEGRYLTLTGNVYGYARADEPDWDGEGQPIAERQSELDALYAEMFPPEPEQPKAPRPVADLDWSDQALLDKAFAASNGDRIRALWDGDISGYPSASEADAALCSYLAFYAQTADRLDSLFRQSALMRPKWDAKHKGDGSTYGQMTTASAIAKCTEFYEDLGYADLQANRTACHTTVTPIALSTKTEKVNLKIVDTKAKTEKCHTVTPIAGSETNWLPVNPLRPDFMVPFPLEAVPDVLGRYVQNVADVVQVPSDLPALAALSVLSFAVCRRWDVQIRASYVETTNLYTAAAMEPGSRKSSALEQMVFPLRAYEKLLINSNKEDRREREELRKASEERLSKRRKDLVTEKDPVKRDEIAAEILTLRAEVEQIENDPRLLVEDVTPEKLVGLLMEQHGTLALVSSEGGVFGTMGGRYSEGQSNLDVYLKAHDGESYKVDRLNRPAEFIEAARLAICLTVQPNVLQSLSKKQEFRGRGLLGRFLYAVPADLRGRRLMDVNAPGIDAELRHEYGEAIRALLAAPPADTADPYARHVVKLSREALAIHADFANRIEGDQNEGGDLRPFSDWASKLAGNAARIAAAFHCLEYRTGRPHETPISADTILQAWAVAEYLKDHAVRAFDMMTESDTARNAYRVLDHIARKKPEEFTTRDCQRWNQKQMDAKAAESALMLLALNNYVRQMERENASGRPVKFWQVNPEFISQQQKRVTV